MMIFDSKPVEIKQLMKAPLYNKFAITQWNLDLSKSKNVFKVDEMSSIPGTMKKRVSFADEKGKELTKVAIIERSEIPSLYSLLKLENSRIISKTDDPPISITQPFDWITSFIQPASMYGRFKTELLKQNIKLATAVIKKNSLSDTEFDYELTGVIKVVNVCFEKRVFLRISSDSKWTSFTDYEAMYKNGSSDYVTESNKTCQTDEFEFQIKLPTSSIAQSPYYLEFAVGLETSQGSYWDSNCDKNYRLDFCQVSSSEGIQSMGMANSTTSMSSSPTTAYTLDYKPNLSQFRNEYTKYRAWNHYSDEMSFY